MSLKKFVGISLVVSLFIVGSILLFGLFKTTSADGSVDFGNIIFPLTYFLLCTILFIFVIKEVKSSFKEITDFLFLLIFGIILCAGISYSATNVKIYLEKSNALSDFNEGASNELQTLSQTNEYYSEYLSYLNDQVSSYKNSSNELQKKIDNQLVVLQKLVDERENVPPIVKIVPAPIQEPLPQPIPQIIIPRRTYEREEEDDD